MTTTAEIAAEFTKLCAAGHFEEAQRYWSDDITSLEPYPGPLATLQGRERVREKVAQWNQGWEMHGCNVQGPFLYGDQFALTFVLDVTPKGAPRTKMAEIGVYTVKDGKIVEERFFAGS